MPKPNFNRDEKPDIEMPENKRAETVKDFGLQFKNHEVNGARKIKK